MLRHVEKTGRPGEKQEKRKGRGSVGEHQKSGTAVPLYGMTGHFFCDGTDRPQAPEYTQKSRAAEPVLSFEAAGRQPVVQRRLLVGGKEVSLKEPVKGEPKKKGKDDYSKTSISQAIARAHFSKGHINLIWKELLRRSEADETYRYDDRDAMIQEAGQFVKEHFPSEEMQPTPGSGKEEIAVRCERSAESVFFWLQDNAEYIVTQTPEWLAVQMARMLGAGPWKAPVMEMIHKTKSSIAGNVIIRFFHQFYNFMIEIHPKGGVHYGAYLLVEFKSRVESAYDIEWKWIKSKRSSYLPGGEKRENTFSREADYDILKDATTTSKKKCLYGLQGMGTPPNIKAIAIKKIFSKKEMVGTKIWSPNEKAGVEQYRHELQERRFRLIEEMPPQERSRPVALEYGHLEKRLLSMRRAIKGTSDTPEKGVIGRELGYIQEDAVRLKELDTESVNAEKFVRIIETARRLMALLEKSGARDEDGIQLDVMEILYLEERLRDLNARSEQMLPESGYTDTPRFARELKNLRDVAEEICKDFAGNGEMAVAMEEAAQMIGEADRLMHSEIVYLIKRLDFLHEKLEIMPSDAAENRLIEREVAQLRVEAGEAQVLFGDTFEMSEVLGRIEWFVGQFEARRQMRLSDPV